MRPARRNWLIVWALIAVGAIGCVVMWGDFRTVSPGAQAVIVLIAAGVAVAPGVSGAVARALDRVRRPSPVARRRMTVVVWVVSCTYLAATAYVQSRDLAPRIHDEASYTIQARMLAHGRLWEPQHPTADFFESFHILVRPVYSSIYFPGAALMNVPGIWAGLPYWVMPVLLAGLVVAMSYRVTAEMTDGVGGLLAALLVLSASTFRAYSTKIMAQVPSALLGLLVAWAYLRWRRERRPSWAVAVGVFAGWAAITRPVDAMAFVIPVGVAMLLDLYRGRTVQPAMTSAAAAGSKNPSRKRSSTPDHAQEARTERTGSRGWLTTIGSLLGGAAPFLLLQLIFNLGVTGRPLGTPYVLYLEQSQPGSVFGSGGAIGTSTTSPAASQPVGGVATTQLRQKQLYYAALVQQEAELRNEGKLDWLGLRLRQTSVIALPSPLLLVFLPVGLLGWGSRRRWLIGAAVPLFIALYLFNPFFLDHYVVPLTPALAFCVVLGTQVLETAGRSLRLQRVMLTFLTLAIAAIAASALPELNPNVKDDSRGMALLLNGVDAALAEVEPPAAVLFRYPADVFHPGANPHEEPVYNIDVAWPDDAPIIRAHDLGPRNIEIFRYYAARDPRRMFYRLDRAYPIVPGIPVTLKAEPLGTAAELVGQHDAKSGPATRPAP